MRDWSSKSFVGGNVVLDFLNTAGGDTKARDFERLETYADVITWAVAAHLVDADERAALAGFAEESPDLAAHCLGELRAQRESLYRFIAASIDAAPIPERDRSQVERSFRKALAHAQLIPGQARPSTWHVGIGDARLSLVRFRLDLAATALMTDPVGRGIRQCEACSWLFLDASSVRRRRWCSMAVCGNRAKAMRHYHKGRGHEDKPGG